MTRKEERELEAKLEQLKEQALIVLADYQSMSAEFVRKEGVRIEMAGRIINNARLIFGLPLPKRA